MKKETTKKLLNYLIFCVLFFVSTQISFAAEPELIITWKADNFYPTSYTGKAIPTYGTKMYMYVEAIQDGKLLDISKNAIEWRKNGERIKRGDGQKEAVVVFSESDRTFFVSVAVDINGSTAEKNISIPVSKPKLVLEIPYQNSTVEKNADIKITATPYFFNAKSLNDFSFSWIINGLKKGTGTNNSLVINTGNPSNSQTIDITGYAQNKRSLLEIIKTQTKVFIKN